SGAWATFAPAYAIKSRLRAVPPACGVAVRRVDGAFLNRNHNRRGAQPTRLEASLRSHPNTQRRAPRARHHSAPLAADVVAIVDASVTRSIGSTRPDRRPVPELGALAGVDPLGSALPKHVGR